MKTSALVLFLALLASTARASDYRQTLECDWQRDLPGIQASMDSSNALLRIRCDSQLRATTLHRFHHLDQQSLATYNRGLVTSPPSGPSRHSSAVIGSLRPSVDLRPTRSR